MSLCLREGKQGISGQREGEREGGKKDTEGVECKADDKLWLINVVRDGSVERCLLMERIRVAVQLNLHTVTLHQAPWSESNETAQQKHTHIQAHLPYNISLSLSNAHTYTAKEIYLYF